MYAIAIPLAVLLVAAMTYFIFFRKPRVLTGGPSIPVPPVTSPCDLKPALDAFFSTPRDDLAQRLAARSQLALKASEAHALAGRARQSELAWTAARELFECAVDAAGSAWHLRFIQHLQLLQQEAGNFQGKNVSVVRRYLSTAESSFLDGYRVMSEGYDALPEKSFQSGKTHLDAAAAFLGKECIYGEDRAFSLSERLRSAYGRAATVTESVLSSYVSGALSQTQRSLDAAMSDVAGGYRVLAEEHFRQCDLDLNYFEQLLNTSRHHELPAVVRCKLPKS